MAKLGWCLTGHCEGIETEARTCPGSVKNTITGEVSVCDHDCHGGKHGEEAPSVR